MTDEQGRRMVGHSLRWKQDKAAADEARAFGYEPRTDDAYDPFNPKGPWTAHCTCGDEVQVKTKRLGRDWHRAHKARIHRNGVPDYA